MMDNKVRALAALAIASLVVGLAAPQSQAQEGPFRQRLRERLQQRQQQKVPSASADAQAPMTAPGDYSFTVQHDGLARMYRVHVPASYDPARPAPLLVALHGGGGDMNLQSNDALYGLITKSESEGFVPVFPNGFSKFPNGKLATWNAGNCCGAARDRQVDDVGFIREVVQNLTHQMNIDRTRIYATGMSNGAMMAYRLACEASDIFTAIAPVAGSDTTRQCTPARPVAVLHIHAKDDSHVLFGGGAGPDSVALSQVTDYVSVPATIAKWAKLDGCTAAPRRVMEKPGAYCEAYAPCSGGAQVQLCVTETGGHSWPGGHKPRAAGAAPSAAISANDVMWEFFDRR
jgi:polyhydroxybutyrate depolymerase